MNTNLGKTLSVGFLSLLLLFCLSACGAEETTPPAETTTSETSTELPKSPELKLNDDGTGTYAELLLLGENDSLKALATVYFHYEGDAITSVDSVRVKNVEGWVSIQQDTELNAAGISYNEERSQAAVPFTYYASIGSGMAVYDNIVVVNLEYREG